MNNRGNRNDHRANRNRRGVRIAPTRKGLPVKEPVFVPARKKKEQ